MHRSLLTAAGLAISGALLLGACSADQTDFTKQTEKFIEGKAVATKVGSTYSCVATAADGSTWDFSAKIDKKNSFKIDDYKQRSG